jgi:hypothetical protein
MYQKSYPKNTDILHTGYSTHKKSDKKAFAKDGNPNANTCQLNQPVMKHMRCKP